MELGADVPITEEMLASIKYSTSLVFVTYNPTSHGEKLDFWLS